LLIGIYKLFTFWSWWCKKRMSLMSSLAIKSMRNMNKYASFVHFTPGL
jgi:hypothetical protein